MLRIFRYKYACGFKCFVEETQTQRCCQSLNNVEHDLRCQENHGLCVFVSQAGACGSGVTACRMMFYNEL